MLWKLGCFVMVLGLGLWAGSCVFFASAAQEVSERRQVGTVALEPGSDQAVTTTVEAASRVKLVFHVDLELRDELFNAPRSRAEIVPLRVPFSFAVASDGQNLHLEAGELSGSTILSEPDHPHADSFKQTIALQFDSRAFDGSENGRLEVTANIPTFDDEGNRITAARVDIFDRISASANQQAIGGLASLIAGPIVGLIGLILVLIGGLSAYSRNRQTGSGPPAPPGSLDTN